MSTAQITANAMEKTPTLVAKGFPLTFIYCPVRLNRPCDYKAQIALGPDKRRYRTCADPRFRTMD